MKFLVTYHMPHQGLDTWLTLPEADRKAQEIEMQTEWNAWMAKHADILIETAGVGRPKRISAEGVVDSRNDIMMYSFIEATSAEAAAEIFRHHPHFGIPESWIEVMAVNKEVG